MLGPIGPCGHGVPNMVHLAEAVVVGAADYAMLTWGGVIEAAANGSDFSCLLMRKLTQLDDTVNKTAAETNVEREWANAVAWLEHRKGTRVPDKTKLTSAQEDIIRIIQSAGHRLTTTQVLNAFGSQGKIVSTGTTKVYFAELVRNNHLTNRRDTDPPGYGLSEWDVDPPHSGYA